MSSTTFASAELAPVSGVRSRGLVALFAARLLKSVLLLFVVSIVTFVLISLSPGNAATTLLGRFATPAVLHALQDQLHLNAPLPTQYADWLGRILHGNLGTSLISGQPVSTMIGQALAPTLLLVALSAFFTGAIGVLLGVVSALRGGALARIVDAFGLLGVGIPAFIIGVLLILLFSANLGWLPSNGYTSLSSGVGPWAQTLVLPVATLVLGGVGFIAKQVRSAMVDAMRSPFVRTLRANGFTYRSVVYKHALRSAAVPVLAALGIAAIGLLGGSVLIEQVFGIPGVGGLAVQAATQKDLPVIQAVTLCYTIVIILVNVSLDIIYVLLNPKVRIR